MVNPNNNHHLQEGQAQLSPFNSTPLIYSTVSPPTPALNNQNTGPSNVIPCHFDAIATDAPPYAVALHHCFTTSMGEIVAQLNHFHSHMQDIQTQLNVLGQQSARLQIKTSQIFNLSCNDGSRIGFYVVPFWDGSCPVRTHDLNCIRNLSDEEASFYCHGYGIEAQSLPKEFWRDQIAKFIGYRGDQRFTTTLR
ncbi:hypothetical protein L218DRAFT_1000604 [Marasmius fiardii PR-910]|nr:hypothetical protein L218DRAFT_1000604 [Marasmius fiardii PR-910]